MTTFDDVPPDVNTSVEEILLTGSALPVPLSLSYILPLQTTLRTHLQISIILPVGRDLPFPFPARLYRLRRVKCCGLVNNSET